MFEPDVDAIYPSLTYEDANAAIAWLCEVFGFRKRLVVPGPDDTVIHSELSLGSVVVMVSSPKEERRGPRVLGGISHGLAVRIEDPDAHHDHAQTHGATIERAIQDEAYGGRGYSVKDLEGHSWYFGSYRPGSHWES